MERSTQQLFKITEYPAPNSFTTSNPAGITSGPDGNLWYAAQNGNYVGRITPSGVATQYPQTFPGLPVGSFPTGIVAGPDGNLWFSESSGATNAIGKMSTAGVVLAQYPVLTANSNPDEIVVGPDGNLWFTENGGNNIGKLEPNPPAVCTISALTTSNTPMNRFTSPAGSIVWFNAHMKSPSNIPNNVISTVFFGAGIFSLNGVNYPLPDGLVTFDPSAPATPSTAFDPIHRR